MSKRRTVFELGRSCEITGLEHVASHHLLSTEILTVPGHQCDAMRSSWGESSPLCNKIGSDSFQSDMFSDVEARCVQRESHESEGDCDKGEEQDRDDWRDDESEMRSRTAWWSDG